MHKKIIALAIASALAAPAVAFAEATVYGQANLSVDIVNDGNSPGSTNNQLTSGGSRLGFKGSEDLDGGMSVVWVLEGDVAVDTGATTAGQLFSRASNIGLKSDSMGTVALGLQDTPYKASTRNLDLFGDSAADNRRLMGIGHDVGVTNAISYSSPSMSGFSVVAATVFGAENAAAGDTKGSALGLAGMYAQGPIYATLAYDSATFGSPGSGILGAVAPFAVDDKSKALKLGGSYAMDAFTVNAVIEKTTDSIAVNGGDTTGTNFYIAGKFKFSSTDAVKLAYTKKGTQTQAGTDLKNDVTQVAIGYDHSLSKATSAGVLYTKVTDNSVGAGLGADPSILSFGLKHSF